MLYEVITVVGDSSCCYATAGNRLLLLLLLRCPVVKKLTLKQLQQQIDELRLKSLAKSLDSKSGSYNFV